MTIDPRAGSRNRLLLAHVILAAGWVGWRLLEATPSLASAWGGAFASSVPGRSAALLSLLAGVLALAVVLVETARTWRDVRTLVLAAALLAAIPARGGGVDVFDLWYLGAVALFATAWFAAARIRGRDPRGASQGAD